MAGMHQQLHPFVIAVGVDETRLSQEEKDFLSEPQKFFGFRSKLSSPVSNANVARWGRDLVSKKYGYRRKSAIFRDLRQDLISASCFRQHKSDPPLCIFCLNCDPKSTALLGPLRWIPKFSRYFAFHYLCAVMTQEIYELEKPSYLEDRIAGLSIKGFIQASARIKKKLKCFHCGMEGALLGCHNGRCSHTYHLPCAIAAGCYINVSSRPPYNYGLLCSKEGKRLLECQTKIIAELVDDDFVMNAVDFVSEIAGGKKFECTVCKVELEIKGKDDPFIKRMVLTSCCGIKATCRSCFRHFMISNIFAEFCTSCKCKYNDNVSNILGMQGFLTLTNDDSDDPMTNMITHNIAAPTVKRFRQAPEDEDDDDDIMILQAPPRTLYQLPPCEDDPIEVKVEEDNLGGVDNPIALDDDEEEFQARLSSTETEEYDEEVHVTQLMDEVPMEEQAIETSSVQMEPMAEVSEPDHSPPMEPTSPVFNVTLSVKQETPEGQDTVGQERENVLEKRLTNLEVQISYLKDVKPIPFDIAPPPQDIPALKKFQELCQETIDVYHTIPKEVCSLDQLIELKQTTLKLLHELK